MSSRMVMDLLQGEIMRQLRETNQVSRIRRDGIITEDVVGSWRDGAREMGLSISPWVEDLLRYWPQSFFGSRGVCHPLASFHHIFWAWVYELERGVRPDALVNCWYRGSSKSTFAEIVPCVVGMRRSRYYILYICATQDSADDHVMNVAEKLSSPLFEQDHPDVSRRRVDKYGQSAGWRRNRLRTESGLTIDALGLDTARTRGLKLEDQRPDLIILDDVDNDVDSQQTIQKNVNRLRKSIIPSGSEDVAILLIQNKIRDDGIMGRLVNDTADYLNNRIMNGPIKAVQGLQYEQIDNRYVITDGIPTWVGKDLERCERELNDSGPTAFLSENQHSTDASIGHIFKHIDFDRLRINRDEMPEIFMIECWVDPAVTNTSQSDCQAVQLTALTENDYFIKLRSWEQRSSPEEALRQAIKWANEFEATCVGVETDQGGDLWRSAYYREIENMKCPVVPFKSARAGQSKQSKRHRVSQQVPDYENGRCLHLRGTHHVLEDALRRFGVSEPDDLCDADYHAWNSLSTYRTDSHQYDSDFYETTLDELTELL